MRRLLLATALAALALASPALAADNYPAKDGLGVQRSFAAKLVGGILHPFHLLEGLFGGVPTPVNMTNSGALDVTVVAGGTGGGAVTNVGTFAVQNTAATPAGANTIGTVNLGTLNGAALASNQTTANTSLGSILTGIGAPADAAWTTGSGSEIALLKAIAAAALDVTTPSPVKFDQTTQGTTNGVVAKPGENHMGEVGGNALPIIVPQTVTAASAYTSGNAVGGLITLSNAVRVSGTIGAPGTTAMLQDITVNFKSTQTAEVDVVFFKANPTGSTCTDKTAFSLAVADFDKVIDVIALTVYAPSLGTPSLVSARNISRTFGISSGTTAYACAITRGTPTFTATSDVSLTFGIVRN